MTGYLLHYIYISIIPIILNPPLLGRGVRGEASYLFVFNDSMIGCRIAPSAGTRADTTLSTTHTASAQPNTAGLNSISGVSDVESEVS